MPDILPYPLDILPRPYCSGTSLYDEEPAGEARRVFVYCRQCGLRTAPAEAPR